MKFKFSLFNVLLFACIIVTGQNPKALRAAFDFVQPPEALLSKDFKYSSSGNVTYEEEVKIEKEENVSKPPLIPNPLSELNES